MILYVREPRCTARTNIKRYYDSDRQKWIRDEMEAIRSYSLSEITDDDREKCFYLPRYSNKWFTPQDDDWEN